VIWGLKDQAVSRALKQLLRDEVQEGCHDQEIRKRCKSSRLAGLMHLWCESWRESPFHSGTAAVEITILRILLFPSVLLLFSLIWFFYPIHLFFLSWF
jgi:hypothetical protein